MLAQFQLNVEKGVDLAFRSLSQAAAVECAELLAMFMDDLLDTERDSSLEAVAGQSSTRLESSCLTLGDSDPQSLAWIARRPTRPRIGSRTRARAA